MLLSLPEHARIGNVVPSVANDAKEHVAAEDSNSYAYDADERRNDALAINMLVVARNSVNCVVKAAPSLTLRAHCHEISDITLGIECKCKK